MIIEGGVGEFVIDGWDGLGRVEAESGGGLRVLTTQAQEQEQEQKQARAREQGSNDGNHEEESSGRG
jgi:hypothetical protein